ncbi:hypothetical protein L0F81_22420 [Streptomyces tricolor]|uniref:Uncharacterized protein n=1 Tax=Streptomyces tricolor TaxID=68277 RepID=A0ABS9JKB8_9ACTN|nr:hypothetical protein [Streptomyces tricolor]MCG0066018.1 hypothetical protein [Streptomyces tricolor]
MIDEPAEGNDPAEGNRAQAALAAHALQAFAQQTGQQLMGNGTLHMPEATFLEVGGDLLADLLHLGRLNGVDPDVLINRGRAHYDAEAPTEDDEWPDAFHYTPPVIDPHSR